MERKDRRKFEENINLCKVIYQKDYWAIYEHPANQGQQRSDFLHRTTKTCQ